MGSVAGRTDRGQTLPVYIWLTVILLFAALAFFAFAQAASARNGAQSAADAAALAAVQASRDELLSGLENAIGGDEDWTDWLTGDVLDDGGALTAAEQLAGENDATVTGFGSTAVNGYPGFQVEIETNYAVGDSIIPGTESLRALAKATAVLKPRCEFPPNADPDGIVELDCDGDQIVVDPDEFRPGDLPDASALFSVHLAE
ncbi:pilus assembly protein TadG-related protein [Streptomyces sp. NPDC059578]|uniref:pilus assembly protein TadG-related protein n=1 Tax=Streptomyces sp. NPDC059578 TaxID=3346874 RepID=UPI00367C31CE